VGRQQAPQDRLLARRRILLTDLDHGQVQLARIAGIGADARLPQRDFTETDRQRDFAGEAARTAHQIELDETGHGLRRDRLEQALADLAEFAVMMGAGHHMRSLVGHAREHFIDVGFPIGDGRDQRGLPQRLARPDRRDDPAVALLLFDRQFLIIGILDLRASPDGRRRQPQNAAVLGIHRQRRMHEQAYVRPVANPPEIVLAPGLGLVIDLGGVLNDQHVSAGRRLVRARRRRFQNFLDRHVFIAEKPCEPHLLGSVVGSPTRRRARTRTQTLQRPLPLFCSRRSPKYPNPMSGSGEYPSLKSAIAVRPRINGR
jgi:hypothetical protein